MPVDGKTFKHAMISAVYGDGAVLVDDPCLSPEPLPPNIEQGPLVVAELAKDQDGNTIFKVPVFKTAIPTTETVFVNIGFYRKLDGSPLTPEQEAEARERDRADLARAMRATEKAKP